MNQRMQNLFRYFCVDRGISDIESDWRHTLLEEARLSLTQTVFKSFAMNNVMLIGILCFVNPSLKFSIFEVILLSTVFCLTSIRVAIYFQFKKRTKQFWLYHAFNVCSYLLALFWTAVLIYVWRGSIDVKTMSFLCCMIGGGASAIHAYRNDLAVAFMYMTLLFISQAIFIFSRGGFDAFAIGSTLIVYYFYCISSVKKNSKDYWSYQKGIYLLDKKTRENIEIQKKVFHSTRLASLGVMSSGIAHELNNPLTAILGHASLIVQRSALGDSSVTRAERIICAGNRMKKIIGHLGQFTQDPGDDEWRWVKILKPISDSLLFLEKQFHTTGISIEVDLHDEETKVYGDPLQLKGIIMAILTNARDSFDGITNRQKKVLISSSRHENSVRLSIRDNGCGISSNVSKKIFDPFFTTKDVGKGTGLGLSLAYDILKKHKAEISFDSTEGEGTSFVVSFPV